MENKSVELFLEIQPAPQERVRFHFKGWGKRRRIMPYIPEKTKVFQNTVRDMCRQYMSEFGIDEFGKTNPLAITAIFYLPRPKSAKNRLAPTVRPDLSNFFKALEDGLQRAVKDDTPALLEDDSAVCYICTQKRYVDTEYPEPGILVRISEWTPDE